MDVREDSHEKVDVRIHTREFLFLFIFMQKCMCDILGLQAL